MPKPALDRSTLLKRWANEDKTVLTTDGKVIYCQLCEKNVECDKKSQIVQHLKTGGHIKYNKRKNQNTTTSTGLTKQMLLTNCSLTSNANFSQDLCHMLLTANIPLKKVSHPIVRSFLQKYCKEIIPSESNLRKKCVDQCYQDTITEIRSRIGNNFLWFAVDETTDVCGRYIANLIVGILNEDIPPTPYLISVKQLEKTNHATVARFVNESLTNFFSPEPVPTEKFLLMLTDAAPYMGKAFTTLNVFYEKLTYVTCFAHGVNRVAELIRLQFPKANSLIKTGKQIFLKAPLRVEVYKEKLPNTPLPLEPVLTRWGTWLEAAIFYAENLDNFKEVVNGFDPDSAASIKECQEILKSVEINNEVAYIKSNFKIVKDTIKKLETSGMELTLSIDLIKNLKNHLSKMSGIVGNSVYSKFLNVFKKNPGYQTMCSVSNVLSGQFNTDDLFLNPNEIAAMKFAPITSVDVERSFSSYKHILSDKRQNFTIENLEKCVIVYCFANKK